MNVLEEIRNIHVSPPLADGSYFIDYENIFTPLADEVILDRTPVQSEPGGRTWGGYGGLSVRFSQDFTLPVIIAPDESENYKKNNWVYMGFSTLTGNDGRHVHFPESEVLYSQHQLVYYQ